MFILGLNLGHNSTAALLKDGKIITCVSEERFTRIKNCYGTPINSIKFLLKNNNLSIKDIDFIVTDKFNTETRSLKHSGAEMILREYTQKSALRKIVSKIAYEFPKQFENYFNLKENLILNKRLIKSTNKLKLDLSKILSFPQEKILIIDHHMAHAFSTCFNAPKNKKTLIFTLDGEGNSTCATVSIFDGKRLKIISKSKKLASIGYLYVITTLFLGMRPLEHEFKVMGLAPYAKKYNIDKVYPIFKNLIWIEDNLEFKSKFSMPLADIFFVKEMKFIRFDIIAGCVQKLTEELICEWITKAIKKTKIHNIALAGGVFMNVKANQKVYNLSEVESMFIMPSCGDESNAMGSCFYGYRAYCDLNNIKFNPIPLKDLYLGPIYEDNYIENLIKENDLKKDFIIKKIKNINLEVAKILAKGNIVARCSGKSEWGARALGNRSILANPFKEDTIKILNETIKDRDFWMPFTPSMLDNSESKYIKNPKKLSSPYMTITFDSTPEAQLKIKAAMHPYDKTIRPQIVTYEYNPDYHDLISHFKKLTGIGAVLNTSFNLHGEPIVLTPEDALHTLKNSSLKFLAAGNYLFEKKIK